MTPVKRWWGIRHVRFCYLRARVWQNARDWYACGIGLGVPNKRDLEHLDKIWRGEA